MIPATIGRYLIKAELGRGGMSTVYLAQDPHFDRLVAIKLLPHELLHHPTFRRRFEREAKIVASLDHPAIVPVYDFGEEQGQPFLVMRHMTGGSLADKVKNGPVTVTEAARIFLRLAPALDEVHNRGVVHRDLKPSNILFDKLGAPYISDFGTAKLNHAQTRLTDTGGAVGTPAYMSPEQIQGAMEIDGRSDIYALGVILFEILTGSHPYQTDTPIGIAVRHIFEPIPHILDLQPDLPRACQAIIVRAMAKNPEERYATASALAADLANVASALEPDSFQIGSLLPVMPQAQAKPVTAVPQQQRRALIIATTQFDTPPLSSLPHPTPLALANKLVDTLQNPKIGGFNDVIFLKNEPNHVVQRAISEFFAQSQPDDILMLYAMGHAVLDERHQLYLLSTDSELNLLRGTAIPASFIAEEMDNSPTQCQLLVMDCHYSHLSIGQVPGLPKKTVDTGASFSKNGRNRIILSAYDATHFVWHNGAVAGYAEPSQFTAAFIDGLESGKADANRDGVITVTEMFDFVREALLAHASPGHKAQNPRKWTYHTTHDVVIAQAALPQTELPVANSNLRIPGQIWGRVWAKTAVFIIVVFVITSLFLTAFGQNPENRSAQTPSANTPSTRASTATATPPAESIAPIPTNTAKPATNPTADASPLPTATAVPTQPPTPTATPTATATISPTMTPEPTAAPETAVALQSSSIFTQPDAHTTELAIIDVDETVTVLGRSAIGLWLYVENGKGIQGFVYGPRMAYEGDFNNLPVIQSSEESSPQGNPQAATNCQAGECPALSLDLYPLPGARCENDIAYRTIYMRGQGGNGRYTYYWNGKWIAGPTTEGFGFEVNNATSQTIIGIGKVVSDDGQTAEKELFINDFSCTNN